MIAKPESVARPHGAWVLNGGAADRSIQRHDANPSTGQVKSSAQGNLILSVPTVALAAHAAHQAMLGK